MIQVRLTATQAVVRAVGAKMTEVGGDTLPVFEGVSAWGTEWPSC